MKGARRTIYLDEHIKHTRSSEEVEYSYSYLFKMERDLERLVDEINRTDAAIPSHDFCPIVREVCEYINALREENNRLMKVIGEEQNV